MAALRGLRLMLCVLPLVTLGACKGIERGDRIDYILMVDKSSGTSVGLAANASFQSYVCLRQQLGIIAVFSKNGSADYSSRPGTIWSSDNENVVHVSNGDDIIPSTDPTAPVLYYPKGTIKPIAPGTATITADYVGIKTSITVHVQNPSSIILSTSPYDATSDASQQNPVSIATNAIQQFYAYATLPNVGGQANVTEIRNVTGNALWTILEDPDKSFASVTNPDSSNGSLIGGGLVTGISTNASLTVNAHFTACEGTAFGDIDRTAKFKVSPVQSITVLHDPNFLAITNPGYVFPPLPAIPNPPNPPHPLVMGTQEAFQAIATLQNGDNQDLSYQALFSTKNGTDGVLTFVGNVATAPVLNSTDGSTLVTATFDGIDSPSIQARTQSATLNQMRIPDSNKNQSIAAGGFYQFHAIGNFNSASGSFDQDMTHSVLWTSNNTAIIAIGNAGMLTGIAVSQNSNQACAKITALAGDGSSDFAILGVAGQVTAGCED